MQLSTFATIAMVLLTYPTNVYANETTTSSLPPLTTTATHSCATITTQGVNCPTLPTCVVSTCLGSVRLTQSCGCASVFTSTTCSTACPTGCAGTSYAIL